MNEQQDHFALLLQMVKWEAPKECYPLTSKIKFCKTDGSRPYSLYESMCEKDGVDDGEPYSFGAYFEVLADSEQPWHFSYPTSLVEDLCNLVVIQTGSVIDFCRLVMTKDGYNSSSLSFEAIDNSVASS